ncbi:MAG: hypothetical protein ACR2M1_08685 [Gemmatimonadaceae bacterium]
MAAIIALLTISAEISSGTPLRAPTGAKQALRADAAAASAVGLAVDEWPVAWRHLTIGGSDTRTYSFEPLTEGPVTSTVTATRESNTSVRFDAVATSPTASSVRSVHGQIPLLQFPWNAPIVTVGKVALYNGFILDGDDYNFSGSTLGCPGTEANSPGVYITDRSQLVRDDSATWRGTGMPMIAVNSALTPASLSQYGGASVQSLIAHANLVYAPGSIVTPASNPGTDGPSGCAGWGDVSGENRGCQEYIPVIYAQGSLTIDGGAGVGIIVADGSVTIQNGARFGGVIIVRSGSFTETGATTYVYGRVFGLDPNGTVSLMSGSAVHSSCAVNRISFARQLSRPVLSTTLADLFQGRDNR